MKLIECERLTQDLLGKKLPGEVLRSGPIPWAVKTPKSA
jgi:hypothetical protein